MPTTEAKLKNQDTYVQSMFRKIAGKYDLLNNLMTMGLHNKWKEQTIKLALKEKNDINNVIDLCSGTGDLALILKKLCPSLKIKCIDSCKEMLKIAEEKFKLKNYNNYEFLIEDIDNISLHNGTYDLITIGFGLRNLANKELCLEKAYNLLKSNGVFACIDLGHPTNILWKEVYYLFFFKIIPLLGHFFAKNKEAYTYLPNSLLSWYKQEELKNKLLSIGFRKVYYVNFLGGVVASHIAVK